MSVQQLATIDFTDLDNFASGFPHELFALHRQFAPVYWHEPTAHTPDAQGFWSVASHAQTLEVLRDNQTYSSVTGGSRPFGGTVLQDLPIAGRLLNMMDDPGHAEVRRLVSSGLTPRMIRRVEEDLRCRARLLLDAVEPGVPFDFLVEVAAELPMQMICILLGVPEADRHWLFEAIEPSFDFRGSRAAVVPRLSSSDADNPVYTCGRELIAAKRAAPSEDMLSVVANSADPQLTDLEVYLFFQLLFSAGAETTRNALAGGLLALAQHPDQWHALRGDFGLLPTAVEEIIRWTSPSPSKRRTATRRAVLGGKIIQAGQKVLVWEGSANRDPAVFDRADEFDVTRKPNPHIGFGHGSHFCLGAHLARLEMRVLYEELLSRFGKVAVVAPVEWTRSNRHTGMRHMMVELRP